MGYNIAVGQSGGPTAAINATLLGVIEEGFSRPEIDKVLGAANGIDGMINGDLVDLNALLAEDEARYLLMTTPAAFLGSCRHRLPAAPPTGSAEYDEVYAKIFEVFERNNIKCFFYIGGNDSMDTVHKLSKYAKDFSKDVRVVGIPKTVDNDLALTDHCPGYGSAAKYVAAIVRETALDCGVYDVKSVTIIEIMGRNAGWLTAASALARCEGMKAPHLIYLPERPVSMDKIVEDVKRVSARNIVIAVSEGVKDESGQWLCEAYSSGAKDVFGHKYLSGAAKALENALREKLGCKARAIELNTPQRSAGHLLSKTDAEEGRAIGRAAVNCALQGHTGCMMYFKRTGEYSIEIDHAEIEGIANKERLLPASYINDEGNDVTQAFLDYARPLIEGEVPSLFKNGVPQHIMLPRPE